MIRIPPRARQNLAAAVLVELAAMKAREDNEGQTRALKSDIVRWLETHYYIPETDKPVKLEPHQKCVLRYMFTPMDDGRFAATTFIYSTVKKSGKSAVGGMVARWMAECIFRFVDINFCGNDMDQARDRGFKSMRRSIEMTPGYNQKREQLPGVWRLRNKLSAVCMTTGCTTKALAVDSRGEAGGAPGLTVWTELWGFDKEDGRRFWDEMVPVPTIRNSCRLIETYAGWEGESDLLYKLYDAAMNGRQLTAHDLALAGQSDAPGESYDELLWAFRETEGDPDALVPVWVNEAAGIIMYWDSGVAARRMPWQHNYVGDFEDKSSVCGRCGAPPLPHIAADHGDRYYAEEEATMHPSSFMREHLNEWAGAESQFVPIEHWDACKEELPPLLTVAEARAAGVSPEKVVIGVDAGTSHDCFAVVAVTRHPDPMRHDHVAVRKVKLFDPKEEGGRIDYDDADAFIRLICREYNVVEVAYDPHQMESLSQRWRKDALAWARPFNQTQPRLIADRALYDAIVSRELAHDGNDRLRQHVLNANAKVETDQESKLRIVKKAEARKIDALVALSMAAFECKRLLL